MFCVQVFHCFPSVSDDSAVSVSDKIPSALSKFIVFFCLPLILSSRPLCLSLLFKLFLFEFLSRAMLPYTRLLPQTSIFDKPTQVTASFGLRYGVLQEEFEEFHSFWSWGNAENWMWIHIEPKIEVFMDKMHFENWIILRSSAYFIKDQVFFQNTCVFPFILMALSCIVLTTL